MIDARALAPGPGQTVPCALGYAPRAYPRAAADPVPRHFILAMDRIFLSNSTSSTYAV